MVDVAMKEFQNIIERFPNYKNAYLVRGNMLLEQSDYDAAESDYSACIRIDQTYPLAYYNLSIIYSNRRNPFKAAYYMCLASNLDNSHYYVSRKNATITALHYSSSDRLTQTLVKVPSI